MANLSTRAMRAYMARRRGTKRSYKSEVEDAAVLIAWAAGELSEGVASRTLGLDRVTTRERLQALVAAGVDRAKGGDDVD